jgi:hypothetical protein
MAWHEADVPPIPCNIHSETTKSAVFTTFAMLFEFGIWLLNVRVQVKSTMVQRRGDCGPNCYTSVKNMDF